MRIFLVWIMLPIAVLFIGLAVVQDRTQDKCSQRGGTLLRGYDGLVCAKIEVLK